MTLKEQVIICPPSPVCRCCECQGKKCLIPHPGHWCGRTKRDSNDEWDAMQDPWLTAFMEWEDRS